MMFLSVLIGFIAGIAGFAALAPWIVVDLTQQSAFWGLGAAIAGWTAAAGLIGCLVQLLTLACLVRGVRGPQAVGFVRPSECRNTGAWRWATWRFYGKGGLQEGIRFLGFEIALRGQRE